MDMTSLSPYTPERGMINLDQTVYHEQNMNSKLSGAAAQIVIPNSKEAPTLTKDGQTMPMSALLKRRQMQVSRQLRLSTKEHLKSFIRLSQVSPC